jgi:DNA (cytosine-5)-methyltransferase 1
MKRSIDDYRNTLYKYFVEVVKIKKPKFFVAENVKGILSLGKGKVFEKIISDFAECGYSCQYAVLNAADYGVPQVRERVIIIGQRNDTNYTVQFPPIPTYLNSHISIGKALADFPDPDKPNNLKNHQYSNFKLKFNGFIGNRIIDPDLPSPTITARGDDKGGVVVLHHPSNQRRLTCREMASIQGFPIDFEFTGSKTSVYRQIANAVPSPLAQAIASTIYKALTESNEVANNSSQVKTQVKQLTLEFSL